MSLFISTAADLHLAARQAAVLSRDLDFFPYSSAQYLYSLPAERGASSEICLNMGRITRQNTWIWFHHQAAQSAAYH
jgi:hypothetical protein